MHLNDSPSFNLPPAIAQWIAAHGDVNLAQQINSYCADWQAQLTHAHHEQAVLVQQLKAEQLARQQAETALSAARQALTNQVEAQTTELIAANHQLQQEVVQRKQIEQTLRESQVCLRLINSISTGITAGLSADHVIEATVQQTGRYFADVRVIYAVLEAGILTSVYSVQPPTMPPFQGKIADLSHLPQYLKILRQRESIIVSDVTQEPFLTPIADQMIARGTRALLAIPIPHAAHQIGMLCFNAPAPRQWSAYEVATLMEVADYLSIVLQEAQAQQERQRAEERLRLLESVVVNGKDAVIITKADVNQPAIIFTNTAFTNSTGYTQAEVLGKTPHILQGAKSDRNQLNQIRAALAQGKSIQAELINYRKDRSEFWIDLNIVPIADEQGDITHYVALQRDITDRKWAEKSLLATQTRLQYLLSSSPSVIYTCQPNRHRACTFVSENIAPLFGYAVWQYLKDPHFWVERIHPADQSIVLASMNDLFELGELTLEYRFLHQNGNYRWLRDGMKLHCDQQGHAIEIIGSVVDISDRKWAEDQIRASLQEKEVMLKEIHHRVKNNLQVISSLLKLQAGYIKDDRILEVFKESQNRVRAMALVHEKLYQSEDLAKTDFAEYVRSLVTDLFRSYAVTRSINLHLDVEEVSLSIDTAIPCGLIINELVSNSLKYAFPAHQTGEIRISLQADLDDRYVLTVADDGTGFPTELDFRRTKSLGLQLVCNLTKQLQGTIDLTIAAGATFKITFSEQKLKV